MMERPPKRARMLSDDESSESEGGDANLATITVNDEYAKRFQHNKAREERQRLEEKYGDLEALEESDSDSESEDDDAELATQELDSEIFATLNAIKSKDPRVYDTKTTFYKPLETASNGNEEGRKVKEKPMNLQDYHRKNLLEGGPEIAADEAVPMTYNQEQDAIKRNLLDQMNTMDQNEDGVESGLDDEEFMVKKPGQRQEPISKAPKPEVDVAIADRDPETYLSNFMAARAWLPSSESQLQPFESEDEDEEDRADAFEKAYNMRFEDPKHSNETLMTHSRDIVAKYSVRRDEATGRKKARELEKAKKEAEKKERDEDKARLRRLKIDEAQEKLQKFKEAAGLGRQAVTIEEWSKFLDAGWDSEKWDQEMASRFGEKYYEVQDEGEDMRNEDEQENTAGTKIKKKTIKRPEWNDDIDIGDIVPEFDEEEERAKRTFVISDNEDAGSDGGVDLNMSEEIIGAHKSKSTKLKAKDAEKARIEQKRQARKERQKLEELVDEGLIMDFAMSGTSSSKQNAQFRYRETSPSTFGLSARDILMADDSQLNQFAGLKKLAAFRDEDKKRKDKKKLGKKARLRQWRKETFGDEEGPKTTFEDYINSQRAGSGFMPAPVPEDEKALASEKKTKKRSRKRKATEAVN